MVTFVLAEDHPLMRDQLKRLLAQDSEFCVVGEAANGTEAIRLTLSLRPDVLLTDLGLPEVNGFDVITQVHAGAPETRVVVVSIHDDEPYIRQAFYRGASAFVPKNQAAGRLMPAIRAVLAGQLYGDLP